MAALSIGLAAQKAHAQSATVTAELKTKVVDNTKHGYSVHTYLISGGVPGLRFDVALKYGRQLEGKVSTAMVDGHRDEFKTYY